MRYAVELIIELRRSGLTDLTETARKLEAAEAEVARLNHENDGRLAAEAERDELEGRFKVAQEAREEAQEAQSRVEAVACNCRYCELEAAYETVVKERDSWRILAEGWKLTNDVEHQGDNQSK